MHTKTTRRTALRALAMLSAGALMPASRAHAQGTGGGGPPVLVDNEKVRVFGVKAKPGQNVLGTGLPSGSPRLAVFMSDAKVKVAQGSAAARQVDYKVGDFVWEAGAPTTAENVGKGEVTVFLVEPKGKVVTGTKAEAKKPRTTELGGKILLDNDSVRVIEHTGRPRMDVCGAGMHTHPDHLTIVLQGGKIKITTPGAEPKILDAPTGAVFWDPSGPHAIQNLGSSNMRSFLIEIKTA